MNRFLIIILLAFLSCKVVETDDKSPAEHGQIESFNHGIASGDPLTDSVIIWTRVTPTADDGEVEVTWHMATDPEFKSNVITGKFITNANRDYTVKVDISGLAAGTNYYYKFNSAGKTSPIGKTKTAPDSASSVSFAVTSCSNYEWGFFNAYGRMAEEKDLDAVIHLGDYIYEYGNGVYGDTTIGRLHVPKYEIITLDDYRTRYAQYRTDEDLQAVHANHPFIAIWDDHEIVNNAYIDGAQNHQDNEGNYVDRKAVAKQVYYEWMPIRESANHYRDFKYGNLATLYMLDERLAGRTKQADSLQDPILNNPDRSMLGATQFNWLADNLKNSESVWKLIGNQVIFSYQNWGYDSFTFNLDGWDGYPAEQQKLVEVLKDNEIEDVVFLAGDTHTAWAFEATNMPFEAYDKDTAEGAIAVEFGVTSINSANANESRQDSLVLQHEERVMSDSLNPHLKYVNMRDHGYLLLSLTKDEAKATFKIVPTNRERVPQVKTDKVFTVKAGTHKLKSDR